MKNLLPFGILLLTPLLTYGVLKVTEGYYDGTPFMELIKAQDGSKFYTQTGDPTATGLGTPGFSIPKEVTEQAFDRGAVGMGGMFSVVKVRKEQKRGDYTDPGWYRHPAGTVAYEFTGAIGAAGGVPDPARFKAESAGSMPMVSRPAQDIEVTVRKPAGGHVGH